MGSSVKSRRSHRPCGGASASAIGGATAAQATVAQPGTTNHGRQHAVAQQADLLGLLGHELRSPLATIKGYAATLRRHERRLSTNERHEYLSAIEAATARLDSTIERILLLAQLDAGSVSLLRAPVDITYLLRDAATAARSALAPEYGATASTLRLAMVPKSAVVVEGDPRLLRVVLDQLIENAVKFTSPGELIDLEARVVDGVPPYGEVSIRNRGQAIPQEHLERIFDRFHQADGGLTREVGGLGLGLAICQRILALHGGQVAAHSDAAGNTFTFRLPLCAPGQVE